MKPNSLAVSIENIGFTRKIQNTEREIFNNFSLEVKAGQKVVLVGPSGSGKSTLLNLVAGLILPSQGAIKIGEQTLSELNEAARSKFRLQNIGYIFQDYRLINQLTALENIAIAAKLAGMPKREAEQKALALMEQLGLDHLRTQVPKKLSGGEKQRLAIARALINEPAIILADEPTSSVDKEMRSKIVDLIFDTVSARTLILSTHDENIAKLFDKVVELKAENSKSAS